MAPEQPPRLVICNAVLQDRELVCSLSYFEAPSGEHLRVRFNAKSQPVDFVSVGDGVAYVYAKSTNISEMPSSEDSFPDLGDLEYQWAEGLPPGIPWQMLILILPKGYTLLDPKPKPWGAKDFKGRLALFWLLKGGGDFARTQVMWKLKEHQESLLSEVSQINKEASAKGLTGLHVLDDPVAIETLLNNHQRRLQKLKEQKAKMGYSTPPEILNEIEDIEKEIEELQAQYKALH